MIIPVHRSDGRRVVQLCKVARRCSKATAGSDAGEVRAFPVIQVIDLDARIGRAQTTRPWSGSRQGAHAIGGGIGRWRKLSACSDSAPRKVIIGTAAFNADGPNEPFLNQLTTTVPREGICWRSTRKTAASS
jgi:hypothetical protein